MSIYIKKLQQKFSSRIIINKKEKLIELNISNKINNLILSLYT